MFFTVSPISSGAGLEVFLLHIGSFLSPESKIKRFETRAVVDSIRTPCTFFQKIPDGLPPFPAPLKSPSMAGE